MQLDRQDVLVLKALRHGNADAVVFPNAVGTISSLIARGLLRSDTLAPALTAEGARLAAMLERVWPESPPFNVTALEASQRQAPGGPASSESALSDRSPFPVEVLCGPR